MLRRIYWRRAIYILGISVAFLVASCAEEIVVIEEEDTSKLDSLETVIRVANEDLATVMAVEAELKRKVDSLNAKLAAGAAAGGLADIVYSVQVVDGSTAYFTSAGGGSRTSSLPDAEVTVRQHGEEFSATTDGTGMVSFPSMKSGIISVTVEIEGFSDVYMIVDLRDGGDDENSTSSDNRYASTQVVVFPTQGAGLFTMSGKVYYNQNLTNDNRDGSQNNPYHPLTGAARYETAANVSLAIDCVPGDILNNTDRPGRIIEAVFAGLKRTAMSAANGDYTLTLPVVLTSSGENFFDYSGVFGSAIQGTQIRVDGDVPQTWFIDSLYPGLDGDAILPGGNSIQDIYYEY